MAAIQIGDVVALGTLAWNIYNLGWSPEISASAQYAAFGADVRGLAESLDVLTSVVNRAHQSLVERGASPSRLRWDPQSLQDIVGDYNATLAECGQLLQRNRSYRETTGALGNIEWNILVQPQVDRLRPRLLLHNSRIQHAMKPFEIDLLTRVYEDLSRQIGEVRLAVYDVQELLNTLIGVLVPDLATALELRRARQICDVNIPEDIRHDFESTFSLHPSILDGGSPPLRDLADSFIDNFEKSTKLFYPGMTIDLMAPPAGQYICLLKCQFLMEKMRTADELLRASEISHWPAYLQSLEENLSYECYRFKRSMAPPDISFRRQDMMLFWRPVEAVAEDEDFITQQLFLEDLLPDGLPLETASDRQWKNVKLMRHLKSNDRRYRLVISSGKLYDTKADRRVVDFDIEKCALNPLYALPQGDSVARELWIEEGINTHRLVFVNLSDLLLFQQALTGYKVVDNHAEYRTKISVVTPDATVISDASIQFWIPRRLSGRPITDISVANQSGSETSSVVGSIQTRRRSSNNSSTINMSPRPGQTSRASLFSESPPARTTMSSALSPLSTSPRSTISPSRTASIVASPTSYTRPPSAMLQSITPPMSPPNVGIPARRPVGSGGGTPASTLRRDSNSTVRNSTLSLSAPSFKVGTTSTSSSSSDHVTTVTLGPSAATSSSGVVHTKPLEPMLVLFVKNPTTFAHSLLAVTIDGDTRASPDLCKCQKTPQACPITAIQQCGGKRPLKVWHLGGERQSKWDLLPLATMRRQQQQGNNPAGGPYSTVIRLSILFQSPAARLKVGGCYCTCKIRTEGDEITCMQKGHMGLLGQVRMHYCRQMELWHQGRFRNHLNVVDRPPDD